MTRDKSEERAALREALDYFEDDIHQFVFALNKILVEDEELPPISRNTVDAWKKHGVPAERAPLIERATDGHVKREDLRPDLYQ